MKIGYDLTLTEVVNSKGTSTNYVHCLINVLCKFSNVCDIMIWIYFGIFDVKVKKKN